MKLRSVQHNAAPVNADSIATLAFSVTACAIRDFIRLRRNHKPVELGGFGYFGFHAIEQCPPVPCKDSQPGYRFFGGEIIAPARMAD